MKRMIRYPVYLALAGLLSACGSTAYRSPDPGSSGGAQSAGGTTNPGGTSGGGGTPQNGGTNNGGGGTPGIPGYNFGFSVTGQGGTQPTYTTGSITTDNLLKVVVTPGPAGNLSGGSQYSNFSAPYYCVTYNLQLVNANTGATIGGTTTTQPLTTGQGPTACQNPQQNQTIDMSGYMTSGHPSVKIQVSAAQYDWYCEMWYSCQQYPNNQTYTCYYSFNPSYYSYYCPLHTVFKNHTITGTLTVQTNGTSQ